MARGGGVLKPVNNSNSVQTVQNLFVSGNIGATGGNSTINCNSLTATGSIGVGVTNGVNPLCVVGNTTVGSGAGTQTSLYHTGTLNIINGGQRSILRIENNGGVGSPTIILGEASNFTEDTVPTIKKIQGTNNLVLNCAGNVGIKTNDPNTTLDVNGTIRASSGLISDKLYLPFSNPTPSASQQLLYTFPNIEADYQIYMSQYFTNQIFAIGYCRTYNGSLFIVQLYNNSNAYTLTSSGLQLRTNYSGGPIDVKLRILQIGLN